MRLSTVLELLVIALLIAFAASRVIDSPDPSKALGEKHRFSSVVRKDRQNQNGPSRYCTCSSLTCNCCREFALPVVPVKGPGCATVSYLHDNAMMITMSFGDRVLRNITVNSKKPKPICMGMPGGISKFCGRLYSIKKEGDEFKACLGLELRALDDIEAALRVSCFKFGPKGVNVEPGEAVPVEKVKEDEDDEDDDDYGLGDLDDDDDDDDDFGLTGSDDDDDDEDEDDNDERPPAKDTYNDVDSSDSDSDYTGFSSLSEELFGGFFGSSTKKKKPVNDEIVVPIPPKVAETPKPPPQVNLVVMQPVIIPAKTSTRPSNQKRPVKKPVKTSTSSSVPAKRIRSTTEAPANKTKITPVPQKIYESTTNPTIKQTKNNSTTNQTIKKKKKPVRRRRPATKKPLLSNSTEAPISTVTSTTMTVNVIQGGVKINETVDYTKKPSNDGPFKVPMTKPVIETKPVEPIIKLENEMVPTINDGASLVNDDTKLLTGTGIGEVYESTTQTIMQNTIPDDESAGNEINLVSDEKLEVQKPLQEQSYYTVNEELLDAGNTDTTDDTTTSYTTKQMYNTNNFEDHTINIENPATIYVHDVEQNYNKIENETSVTDKTETYKIDQNIYGTTVYESVLATQPESATISSDKMEEATDKTEALSGNIYQSAEEKSSNEEDESEDDDDDDVGLDIGTDLGLDDDDSEEDENGQSQENSKIKQEIKKKGNKDEDEDDDDILGGLLDSDDDEDEDEGKDKEKIQTKEKVQERKFESPSNTYQINPLLFQLARISSGSIATARHFPRFDEGRNRRNNKRMRFASLDVSS